MIRLNTRTGAGTLLVTGSSSVRMWDSIHSDLAPYHAIQRGYASYEQGWL